MIPYLEAENTSGLLLPPTRCALVQYYLDSIASFWEGKVNLDTQAMVSKENLVGKHSYTDAVEMQESEKACLADPRVQDEIKSMELPEDAVVCIEPWTYAPDGMEDMTKRRIMVSPRA
jgi:primary-amine oxidase